jgi:uncharacterized protein YqhQ
MTLSPWIIYLWGIADQIRTVSIILIIILALATGACALVWAFMADEDDKSAPAWAKRAWKIGIAAAVFAVASAFFPSSKTIAVMVVLPAIVNSEPIQKDLPELYRMAIDSLKAELAPAK